jgi:hypothetical protein
MIQELFADGEVFLPAAHPGSVPSAAERVDAGPRVTPSKFGSITW